MKLTKKEKSWYEKQLGRPFEGDEATAPFLLGICQGLMIDKKLDAIGRKLMKRANEEMMPILTNLSMEVIPGKNKEWKHWVKINTKDAYSAVCVKAVMLIGDALDKGMTPEESSHITSIQSLGLTGFQMGTVANALYFFSPKGDDFRRWWNLRVGGNRGETANDRGSVLNPAIITIGK